jgi:hypothetical protein
LPPPPQRKSLAGTLDTVANQPLPDSLLVALAPCDEFSATLELRFTLEGELERLAIQTDHEAALRLAYFAALVPLDELAGYLPDIAVSGTIGSEGSSDTGVGTGVPVLGGGGQISRFRFEITAAVEDPERPRVMVGPPRRGGRVLHFPISRPHRRAVASRTAGNDRRAGPLLRPRLLINF